MLGDKWTSLNEEEHFGAMKHCLEFESGTIGTTRAWAGGALRERRLLQIQMEYLSLIIKDNVQSHDNI